MLICLNSVVIDYYMLRYVCPKTYGIFYKWCTSKVLGKTVADDVLNFYIVIENKSWHFMWIACYLHKIQTLISKNKLQKKKKKKKKAFAAVVISALGLDSISQYINLQIKFIRTLLYSHSFFVFIVVISFS